MVHDVARVKSIFLAAVERYSAEQWPAYLDEACGADIALRERVEKLLGAHGGQKSLDVPAPSQPGATVDQPSVEQPGTVIGPYKLVEQIGEGGMGLVHMAEQERPLRRLVALKIIKPGMDSRQVLARFEAEKQALAMMDHENIAKVFDAGTTETGHPFFVMELVRGVPINEFCDQKRLTVRERLELFVQVCAAVQHAHQKGIIHRDLKPTNVLVTMHDVRPVPKVIDFGIAKALGASLTEQTLHTGFAQLVGTPLYMSPEQAEMNQLGVDTRSDVYSLGVLLYELLTGTTPFDKEALGRSGLDEMRRMIREDEPPRPSARVSSLQPEALSTTSQRHSTDPRRISAALHGELDWIVMKSLEKDRSRRYESASAFANDIRRYLDDEPVLACPPSTMYKLHKFARKHRAAIATAVAIATSLILGTTASAWQAVRATTAEAQANANSNQAQEKAHEATAQRDEAQKQRDEVRALNDKLLATNEKLQVTQAELRSTLYAAHMNLAKQAWDDAAISRVLNLLEQHRPKPGEPDQRGFEWHYLHHLCQADPALLTLKLKLPPVPSVAYSPDGKHLIGIHMAGFRGPKLVRHDPELKVWDAQTGREILTLTLKGGGRNVVLSPDGKRLAADSDLDKTVKVWDAQTGQELLSIPGAGSSDYGAGSVVFSPDSKRLTNHSGRELKVWDAQTGQELLSLKGGGANSVAFSPDGKRLAGVSTNSKVVVWDSQTGQELLTFKGQPGWVQKLAFSPDGKRLASHCGGYVQVWDAHTGQKLFSVKEPGGFALVAFSPDGKRLATADNDATSPRIKVWDAQTGQAIFAFQGHTARVDKLIFSPDGSRVASSSNDQMLRIWDLQTGQEALSG